MGSRQRIVEVMTSLLERMTYRTDRSRRRLATQLERQGHDISDDLWSARLLRDDPDAIVQAHREFFRAGAEVATSASYQASFDGFAAHGIDRTEAVRLMRLSVELARRAADEVSDRQSWVAASVGPYGATLADGSEYRGDYGLSVSALREFHRPRLEVLAESGADVLAIETIPCAAEVEAVLLEVQELDVPAWLSLTVDGSTTRAGEPLADVYAMAADVDEVIAVGSQLLATERRTWRTCALRVTQAGNPASPTPTAEKHGTPSSDVGTVTHGSTRRRFASGRPTVPP